MIFSFIFAGRASFSWFFIFLCCDRARLIRENVHHRRGINIPPEYTICPCHLQQPETSEHFKQCPLAQGDNHLATWKPEDTIAQHAGWGPTAPPANEVRRLMWQPEIKEAVLRGAVPLQLYRVVADHALEP